MFLHFIKWDHKVCTRLCLASLVQHRSQERHWHCCAQQLLILCLRHNNVQSCDFWPYVTTDVSSAAAAAAKSLQSCLTLCDPIDSSPPGSPVPGILHATTLEWVAISFSNAGKWKVKVKLLSRARLLVTPWIAAHQAPLSMGFSRQEYWSGVPWLCYFKLGAMMSNVAMSILDRVFCSRYGCISVGWICWIHSGLGDAMK